MIKIKFPDYSDNMDGNTCLLQLIFFNFELKFYIINIAGYAGWLDCKDHNKGINKSYSGYDIRFTLKNNKKIIEYPSKV